MLYINYVSNTEYENFIISQQVNDLLRRQDDEDYLGDHDVENFREVLLDYLP